MTDRIIDIADTAAYLRVENARLIIEPRGGEPCDVPLEDIAVLLLAHGDAVLTQAVLAQLPAAGGVIVACDRTLTPAAMTLPYRGHYLHTERLRHQCEAGEPLKKRLWQQIVRAKIARQGDALQHLYGDTHGFASYLPKVRSGDPDNIEGLVARRYWACVFRDHPDFARDYAGDGLNALLNYGYAILRAMVARAACAAGLHPACGLHHRNRYNAFCLADDLMEPFRPLVDVAVARMAASGNIPPVQRPQKQYLVRALTAPVMLQGRRTALCEALRALAQSLVDAFAASRKTLLLPVRLWPHEPLYDPAYPGTLVH